uniref:Uncharacterized protein n=1 Tax=Strigamia maritima TaxID=126957 RepID=T1J3L1_STRMM
MPSFRQYLIWFANEHVKFKLPVCLYALSPRCYDFMVYIKLWGRANLSKELHSKLKNLPEEFLRPNSSPTASFKFVVESFCKSLDSQEKLDKIEAVDAQRRAIHQLSLKNKCLSATPGWMHNYLPKLQKISFIAFPPDAWMRFVLKNISLYHLTQKSFILMDE